jgi:hypothetical protein
MQSQAQRMSLPVTIAAVKRFSEAIIQLKSSYQPQLPLELAFIEAVNGEMIAPALAISGAAAAPIAATTPIATTVAPPTVASVVAPMVSATVSAATVPETKPGTASNNGKQPAATETNLEPPPLDHNAVKKLRNQWKQLQAQIKADMGMSVVAAFNCVRDIAVSDQGVALAFGNNAFAKDMLSQSENHNGITRILSDFLGRPVQLECQMGEQAKLSRRVASTDQTDSNTTDPLVEYAVNNLGAIVVDDEE